MSNIFFISDTHFGHVNILTFEPVFRPFKTIEEHDEVLVSNWNKTVKKGDIVYHLGDFTLSEDRIQIANRLNGDKRLILGNHDKFATATYMKYFTHLYGCKGFEGVWLSHIPVHPYSLGNRATHNIHGHLHSKNVMKSGFGGYIIQRDERYLNVGCEQIGLTPVAWEDLKLIIEATK